MKKLVAFVALAGLLAAPAMAEDGAALYASKTCAACHGADGKKTLMPNYPKIAGQNVAYLEQQMLDIKSGKRNNGQTAAMKGVMHLVDEAQIKVLADYISKMAP